MNTITRIISFNVNGFRRQPVINFLTRYIKAKDPQVVFLSEIKADEKLAISLIEKHFPEYNYIVNSHSPSRYHGVLMIIKKGIKYEENKVELKCKVRSDNNSKDPGKGRIISVSVGDKKSLINIVGTYVPNSGSDWKNPLKNLDYRINEWDKALFSYLNSAGENKTDFGGTIWLGDINVCPENIDVSHPSKLNNKAGFHIRERKSFNNFLKGGIVENKKDKEGSKEPRWFDIWRTRNPEKEKYTWEGKTTKMRLDNIVISSDLLDKVKKTFILKHYSEVSDHSLIGIVLETV